MKRLLIAIIAAFFALNSFGQLSLTAGPQYFDIRHPSFDEFRYSLNHYLQDRTVKPLGEFKPAIGTYVGMNVAVMFMFLDFSYNRTLHTSSVSYTGGQSRDFELMFRSFETSMGFGYRKKNFGIWGCFGFMTGGARLATWFVYPDGTKEYGPAHQLNGVYWEAVSLKTSLGIKLAVPMGKFAGLLIKADWLGKNGRMFDFWDNDNARILGSQARLTYIPVDYEGYL
ncbi:MAG: hypothetical protein KKA07_15925, partial [Bacteroidetes bacterium]|nr:hypothetical protein [Bacteroidota bacterium]